MTARAVLIGLDKSERVVSVQVPPSEMLDVPVPPKWNINNGGVRVPSVVERRTFRLSRRHRSRTHRWMRIYNEGRTQTPEDGYVYFEVR